jgi:hypothetical protein
MFTLFLCMTLSMVQVYRDILVKFSTCQELRQFIPVKFWAAAVARMEIKKIYCCAVVILESYVYL